MVARWLGLLGVCLAGVALLSAQSNEAPITSSFPKPFNTEPEGGVKALAPEEAASGFRLPDGFHVSVFAAEPDVQNPIAMTWDDRGRLWVAENYTYSDRTKKHDLSLRDRVLIFEDSDGDGRHDKRTVFTEDVQMLTGIEIGNGGVWLMTPPHLVFVPDANGDDKPDEAPIVMLDGFTPSTDNYHTFANGLKWGPDGWLYGRCGASSPGSVGVPGTPEQQRVPMNGGVWRYRASSPLAPHHSNESADSADGSRPAVFEVLCHGTTNPWGMDWNEFGEAFFINTVNGHLWHVIPGAHFKRPHSEDPNPTVYELIDQHADHYHWDTGKDWTDSRKVTGEHDRLGGGHAHSGMSIYLGDNWPKEYRGNLLTLNLHGRRVNIEQLEREGSGYVGKHKPDMLNAADPWFRGIDLSYGPNGAVYLLDWSDTGECHEHTGVHRTSGRIYCVWFGDTLPVSKVAVNKLDARQLVELHRHPNEWHVRQARRALANRFGSQIDSATDQARTECCTLLKTMFEEEEDIALKLRAMWTLYQLGGINSDGLLILMRHANEHVRAWSVRLLTDDCPLDTIQGNPHPFAKALREEVVVELIRLAKEDDSGLVRLALATALQRLPIDRRLELAAPLASRLDDANDHNLPLMLWYGLMPVATRNSSALAEFATGCRFPITRRLAARRVAELIDSAPEAVNRLLARATNDLVLLDILDGLSAGFAGRHKVGVPSQWEAVQARVASLDETSPDNMKLQERVRDLSVLFGDGRALDEVKRVALDGKAEMASRKTALQTLIDSKPDDLRDLCEKLLSVRSLNAVAVRGLAAFDDPALGEKLSKSYRSFYPQDRPAVIETLVSRPSFAKSLLAEMASGKIARADVSAFQARQIRSFDDADLTKQLIDVWGELRDSPEDKRQLAEKLKAQLTIQSLQAANKSSGRVTFNKLCANCHRLYGNGASIGPDLTGAGRHNLDYVIDNMVDPSAVVGADYRMSVLAMNDGRVLNGIVSQKTDRTLVLQTAKERLTIALSDIEEFRPSTLSLMPDGQLLPLTDAEVRDLVAYLMHPTQVPLPKE